MLKQTLVAWFTMCFLLTAVWADEPTPKPVPKDGKAKEQQKKPQPKPPGPPVRKLDGPAAKKDSPAKKAKPEILVTPKKPFVWDAKKPKRIYRDKTWTHIGDNNFSKQSDGADDLRRKSSGLVARLEVVLTKEAIAEAKKDTWKTVIFRGSCIGNDTGRMGQTKATDVTLNGKKIGIVTKSGTFKIQVPKALILKPNKDGKLVFRVATGKNGASDWDDQELGRFALELSEKEMPKPKKPVEKKPVEKKPGK